MTRFDLHVRHIMYATYSSSYSVENFGVAP